MNKEKPRYMCWPIFEPVVQEHKPEAIPFEKQQSRCDAVSTTSDLLEASGGFRSG